MKIVVALLVVVAAVAADTASDSLHVKSILSAVAPHKKDNAMFSELEAQVLNAVEGTETKSGRSPTAEISAMTDMMIIQVNSELGSLIKTHKATQATCVKTLTRYSSDIEINKRKDKTQLENAMVRRRTWEVNTHKIPPLHRRIANLRVSIQREEDLLEAAQARRNKRHEAFKLALDEHFTALQDIQNIRSIVQNSKLDDKSHKTKTVSAGDKTAAVTKHGGKQDFNSTLKAKEHATALLELKTEVHPKLQDVVLLAHQAVSSNSGVDLIYRLLYQTRDQLVQSQEKLVKSEKTAIGNWRRNKLAFRADINDLRIDIANTYMTIGTIKFSIGTDKKKEGEHKLRMQKAITKWTADTIKKDFLSVFCEEDRVNYASNLAAKRNEKAALTEVQKRLVKLKWSEKVYAAIQSVNEGVVYLKGDYNVRSVLDKSRYMIRGSKGQATFAQKGDRESPEKFEFKLQSEDLTYHIISKDEKKTYYLTEKAKGQIKYARSPSKSSAWNVEYDTKSGYMNIRNKVSENTLYLSQANGFIVNTHQQTQNAQAQFIIERPSYRLKGCYKNKVGHQLEHYLDVSNTMNTGKCYRACKANAEKKGYEARYFGLTEGKQCFCGTKFDRSKAPITDCGYICNGREGDLCGGSQRTLVYTIAKGFPSTKGSKKDTVKDDTTKDDTKKDDTKKDDTTKDDTTKDDTTKSTKKETAATKSKSKNSKAD